MTYNNFLKILSVNKKTEIEEYLKNIQHKAHKSLAEDHVDDIFKQLIARIRHIEKGRIIYSPYINMTKEAYYEKLVYTAMSLNEIAKHKKSIFYKVLCHKIIKRVFQKNNHIHAFFKNISQDCTNLYEDQETISVYCKEQLSIYFSRTITLLNQLFPETLDTFIKSYTVNDFNKRSLLLQFYIYVTKNVNTGKQKSKALREICIIEYEKIKRNKASFTVDLNFEAQFYQDREFLMQLNTKDFLEQKLVLNPDVTIHQSNWEWVLPEVKKMNYDFSQNLQKEKQDFFFLFQSLSIADAETKSTVFEYPLTDYQYVILEILETPLTIKNTIDTFIQHYVKEASEKVRESWHHFIYKLIRDAVFQKFLILEKTKKSFTQKDILIESAYG